MWAWIISQGRVDWFSRSICSRLIVWFRTIYRRISWLESRPRDSTGTLTSVHIQRRCITQYVLPAQAKRSGMRDLVEHKTLIFYTVISKVFRKYSS